MGNRVGSTPTTRTSTLEQAFLEEMSALIFFIMEKDPMRFFSAVEARSTRFFTASSSCGLRGKDRGPSPGGRASGVDLPLSAGKDAGTLRRTLGCRIWAGLVLMFSSMFALVVRQLAP